jgi:uncharacterized protein YndB with AHSA1/START domain
MQSDTDRDFVISRTFNAARNVLWKVCTDVEHMKQWFGPKGFTTRAATMDFRPGGIYHYCLESPDGQVLWGKFVFREIVEPERFVSINSFSDEHGGTTHHPMSPSWPLEMLSTFTFTEEGGRTTLTIRWSPLNPTAEEQRTFDEGRESMRQGWTGTLDRLETYLATM